MLNFFRKIRRKLAFDNKVGRYIRYAIGEVVLIMLGIFMALQLQNWNENRKKEIEFKNTVEQLYNDVTDDSWYYGFAIRELENRINDVDVLLDYEELTDIRNIPGLLWRITRNYKTFQPKSLPLLKELNYKPDESELAKLAVQLSDYTELINTKGSEWINIETEIDRYLIEANIPFPKFDIHHIDKGYIRDSTYYSNAEFANALNLLKNENFRTRLKSHRTILSIDYLDFKTLEEESIAILNRIKRSVPNVKLLYEDVGIIGTSINGYDDVGANSTPMILKDENKSIWEIDIFLKEGSVKFRCRDSWAINWGGLTFPEGTPLPDGPDILVEEAGNYKVILDITGGKYEFIKLED